jgi:hypothetical protein
MAKSTISEQELREQGWMYLGEYGIKDSKIHVPNQLWRKDDELIIYDPEIERILFREFNEERYQYGSGCRCSLSVGKREHK